MSKVLLALTMIVLTSCNSSKNSTECPTTNSIWYFLTTENFPDSKKTSNLSTEVFAIEQTLFAGEVLPQKITIHSNDDRYEALISTGSIDTIITDSRKIRIRFVINNPHFIVSNACELKENFFIEKIVNTYIDGDCVSEKNDDYKFSILINEEEVQNRSEIKCDNLLISLPREK